MVWVKRIEKEHSCNYPFPYKVGIGSVWECDCGQLWRLKSDDEWGYAYKKIKDYDD